METYPFVQPSLLTSFIFHLHISCTFHLRAPSLELPLFLSTLSLELIPHWVFPPEDRAATSSELWSTHGGGAWHISRGKLFGHLYGWSLCIFFPCPVLDWCVSAIFCLLSAEGLPRLGNWMHCTAARILIQDLEFSLLLFRPLFGPSSSLLPTGSLADYQSHWGPAPTPKWAQETILGTKLNFNNTTALASPNPTLISA